MHLIQGQETMCASYNIWLISWTCLARQLLQLQFAYESFQSRCPNGSWNQSPRDHKEDVIANLCKIKYLSKYNTMPCHIPGTEQYTPPTLFAKKKKGAYIQTFGLSLRTAETQRFGRLLSTPQTTHPAKWNHQQSVLRDLLPSFQSSATNLSEDWCRSVATLSFRGSMFFISHSSAL